MRFSLAVLCLAVLQLHGVSLTRCMIPGTLVDSAQRHYALLEKAFGSAPYSRFPSICQCRRCFFEIEGGLHLNAVYDRKNNQVLLRHANSTSLMHEITHFYLDQRLGTLSASLSEKMTRVIDHLLNLATTDSFAFKVLTEKELNEFLNQPHGKESISTVDIQATLTLLLHGKRP